MTTPPNTQPDAAQIVREIRAKLADVYEIRAHYRGGLGHPEFNRLSPDRIAVLLDAFDAQTKEIAELREALEPFSKMADQVDEWQRGTKSFEGAFHASDLHRARYALRTKEIS